MEEQISDQECFEIFFAQFVAALRILALDAENQCSRMGNFNVSWELRDDVSREGHRVRESDWNYLTQPQLQAIQTLLCTLEDLPEDAIYPPGAEITGHSGSLAAMRHPAWESLRSKAAMILELLKPEIDRNASYFS